jgi:hypothetical protein
MLSSLLCLHKRGGVAAAALRRVIGQSFVSPHRDPLNGRGVRMNADKSAAEADKKVREGDRRLNCTPSRVCVGC